MTSSQQELIPEEVTWGDLGYLANYQLENQELVADRAAGSVRIQEDLIEAEELSEKISVNLAPDGESVIIMVPERQHKILINSRRLGGVAAPIVFN